MILRNKLPHMAGQEVNPGDGTIYKISADGIIVGDDGKPLDVPKAHAERMLKSKHWVELVRPARKAPKPPALTQPKADAKTATAKAAPAASSKTKSRGRGK